MERIVYRKTLDVHKNGIQFTLQGFETADNMARRIEISLMASGDTIDLPLEQLIALMYITTPNATEPSINECTIKDNTIIYDVLPIVEEGITEMQLKLIDSRPEGAKGVLASPRFAVEVTKSNADDESATQTTTFTALEDAIAKAKGVYDSRLMRVEIDTDCTFRAYFADGTVYETDVLHEALYKGEALLSQSYARGDSGIREGEETDNSMYYSNVSKSASTQAVDARVQSEELLTEVRKHGVYTAFSVDFTTGEIKYISPTYKFDVNEETGELDVFGETYTPEKTIDALVTEWLTNKSASLDKLTDNTCYRPVLNISLSDKSITLYHKESRYFKLGGFVYLYFYAGFVYSEDSTKVDATITIDETTGDLVPSFTNITNYFPMGIRHSKNNGTAYVSSHSEGGCFQFDEKDGKPRLSIRFPRPDGIALSSVYINVIFPITE